MYDPKLTFTQRLAAFGAFALGAVVIGLILIGHEHCVLGREISLFAATERREERREQLSSGAVETGDLLGNPVAHLCFTLPGRLPLGVPTELIMLFSHAHSM
ncbi:unnamed protein product [Durusdinium trenchii]|uniref:Uncharacterized protein n=1 Tax=Durusdinium trenchii TaxID=1381693 RepID=A0ABP0MPI2_9DINO